MLKPNGSSATLSSTTIAKPTFTAGVKGTYVVELVVNDGKTSSSAATVSILTSNPAPVFKGVVYPVVAGLSYLTSSTNGVVASDGSYTYQANENVTFSVGGIEIATALAGAKTTLLPLGNDVAATNMLRFLKSLDTNSIFGDGITLPKLTPAASPANINIDWTIESSVAAALKALAPAGVLTPASDAELKSALATAKDTALQSQGAYGPYYKTINNNVGGTGSACSLPLMPKVAEINFTSQPNWSTEAMAGSATLTFNDNSKVSFPFSTRVGSFKATDGTTMYYGIVDQWNSPRIIALVISSASPSISSNSCALVLRDPAIPNKLPVPFKQTWYVIPTAFNATFYRSDGSSFGINTGGDPLTHCYYESKYASGLSAGSQYSIGSYDTDGFVVSQKWVDSSGKIGTDKTFQTAGCADGKENFNTTLTVTDDEGASSSDIFPCCTKHTTGSSSAITFSAAVGGQTSYSFGTPFSETNTTTGTYPIYSRIWLDSTSTVMASFADSTNAGGKVDLLEFVITAPGLPPNATDCSVSGSAAPFPTCTNIGVTLNRAAGTLFLQNARLTSPGTLTLATPITWSGTLRFTPY
jgi:hypothetical protein